MENESSNQIVYRPIEKVFTKKGFIHRQLFREGDFAIYWKYAEAGPVHPKAFDAGYETVIIHRHNGYELGGVKIEPAETYPSDSQWGDMAWTFGELIRAYRKWESLVASTVVVDVDASALPSVVDEDDGDTVEAPPAVRQGRGRPRGNKPAPVFTLPDREFTMQEVSDLNKISKPNMYVIIAECVAKGDVKELRRESRGKGRPTVIYAKVEKPSVPA